MKRHTSSRSRLSVALCVATLAFALWPTPLSMAQAFYNAVDNPARISVQSVSAAPEQQANEPTDDDVPFDRLSFGDLRLNGPYASVSQYFGLPMTWRVKAAGRLELDLDVVIPGMADVFAPQVLTDTLAENSTSTKPAVAPAPASQRYGGDLRIVINNVALKTVALNASGEYTVAVPIPIKAFGLPRPDGLSVITFELNDPSICGNGAGSTSVMVRESSHFVLPHQTVALQPNLNELPRPLFQRSIITDTALLVVPDAPSATDLQAALNIAAGFGRMTDGKLGITLTKTSDVTKAMLAEHHLIFVGRPSALPQLTGMALPMSAGKDRFAKLAAPDDGVVQMIASPWNESRAALIVSANTDTGLLKAAQAVGSGALRADKSGSLAVISAITPMSDIAATGAKDSALSELGYADTLLSGKGTRFVNYTFSSPIWPAKGDAMVDLSFAHSALLDYEQSGATVILNGQLVGALRFSDNSTRVSKARITLPRTALRATNNTLLLRVDMIPRATCFDPRNANGLWVSILSDTSLHFAAEGTPAADASASRATLADFPAPFASAPNLAGVAFVISKQDASAWNAAAQLARELGRRAGAGPLSLVAAFADDVSPAVRAANNIVIVGRASQLLIVTDLNGTLPAPFAAQGDVADDSASGVQLRLPADADVGYLQIVVSPWQAERKVLLVMGTTPTGVQHAASALIKPDLRGKLSGNLAIISGDDGDRIVSANTLKRTDAQKSASADSSASSASSSAVSNAAASAPAPATVAAAPSWITPVVIGAVVLLTLILGISGLALVIQRRRFR